MPSITFAPGVQVPPDPLLVRFLQPTRRVAWTWLLVSRFVPVVVTSWWRSSQRNIAVGGSPGSQHLVGTAIDALSPGLSRSRLLPVVQWAANRMGATAPSGASPTSGRSVHVQGLPVGFVSQLLRDDPGLLAQAEGFVGPPRNVG